VEEVFDVSFLLAFSFDFAAGFFTFSIRDPSKQELLWLFSRVIFINSRRRDFFALELIIISFWRIDVMLL